MPPILDHCRVSTVIGLAETGALKKGKTKHYNNNSNKNNENNVLRYKDMWDILRAAQWPNG